MRNLIFFLFLVSVGCQEPNGIPKNIEIDVNVVDRSQEILMSSIVDSIYIIPLGGEKLITRIDDMIWAEDRVIFLDKAKAQEIYIYNLNGEFIRSIDSGNGEPGKFVFPKSLALAEDGQSFYIISGRTFRIFEYDLNGNPINDYDIKDLGMVDDILAVKNGFVLTARQDSDLNETIIFTSKQFQKETVINASDFYLEPDFLTGNAVNYLYPTKDLGHFFYQDVMSNRILEIEDRELKAIHNINLPDGYEVDYNIVGRSTPKVMDAVRQNGLVALQNSHINFGDYMVLNINNSGVGQLGLFNIKTSQVQFLSKIVNDMSILVNVDAIWGDYNNSNNMLVTAIDAPIMVQLLENIDLSQSPYSAIFDKLDVSKDDNPVLIVYKLKEDYEWPFD